MLATVVLLVALAAGTQAQCVAPNDVSYEFCGQLLNGRFELYWTYREAESTLALLFSVPDDGWSGFGWSAVNSTSPMVGAHVFPGCSEDFNISAPADADFTITARSVEGFETQGQNGLTAYEETRNGARCWVRIERPFAGGEGALTPVVISDTPARIVFAHGGDEFARHSSSARGTALINFADGTGIDPIDGAAAALSISALVPALIAAAVATWQ